MIPPDTSDSRRGKVYNTHAGRQSDFIWRYKKGRILSNE